MSLQETHFFPCRCLVPKKVKNLLVAGRCISLCYAAREAVGPL
ncbi:MAG: FAD-dependent oxidoreductase [Candidatus Bathyarchaeia archaeon]